MAVFSRIRVYEVHNNGSQLNKQMLESIAKNNLAKKTTATVIETIGFEPPFIELDPSAPLVETIEGHIVMQLIIEERKPKMQEVRKEVTKRVHALKKSNPEEKVTKKVQSEIRKQVKADLVKSTPPTTSNVLIAFDMQEMRVMVGQSSKGLLKKISEFLAVSCKLSILEVNFHSDMNTYLTMVLENPGTHLNADFELGNDVGMQKADGKLVNKAMYSNQDLIGDEIELNLTSGKTAYFVAFEYKSFVLFRVNVDSAITNAIVYDHSIYESELGAVDKPDESLLIATISAAISEQLRMLKVLVVDIEELTKGADLGAEYLFSEADEDIDVNDPTILISGSDEED